MEKYLNLKGNSSIVGYCIGDTYIDIKFNSGPIVYRYTYASAGVTHIEKMKELAQRGYGLNAYIDLNCKYLYETKLYY